MKTLVKDGLSLYVFANEEPLILKEESVTVGNPAKFIIGDCNSSNTVLYESVTVPEDWTGHKYFFDGTDWTLNPNWIDPETLIEEEEQ